MPRRPGAGGGAASGRLARARALATAYPAAKAASTTTRQARGDVTARLDHKLSVASLPPIGMPRPSLEISVRDPGFTPSVRDVPALIDLLADDDLVADAERAIARVGPSATDALRRRFEAAAPPLRARVLRAIGRLEGD